MPQGLFTGMYRRSLLMLIFLTFGDLLADIQYDGCSRYVIVNKYQYVDPDGSRGFQFTSLVNADRQIHDNFFLTFNDRYVGVNNTNLYPENTIPSDNMFDAGLRFTGLGTLQCNFVNSMYYAAEPLSVPYYPAGTEIVPQMLNTGESEWVGDFDWFHTDLKISSNVYNYKFQPQDRRLSREVIESAPYGEKRDVDLWADLSMGVDLPIDISVDGGAVLKNDLNGKQYYNLSAYWVGLSGEHMLNRKKVTLSWNAKENYIQSQAMEENGYADGFSTSLMMRIVWRKRSDLFIKGEACIDVGQSLFKQYYELQLRKTWTQGSSLDILYCATNGVLFPRQIMAVNPSFRLLEHFGLSPSIAMYFTQFPKESSFRYYRSDYKMELLFHLNQRLDFYAGYGFMHYLRHPLLASRNAISAGFRTW